MGQRDWQVGVTGKWMSGQGDWQEGGRRGGKRQTQTEAWSGSSGEAGPWRAAGAAGPQDQGPAAEERSFGADSNGPHPPTHLPDAPSPHTRMCQPCFISALGVRSARPCQRLWAYTGSTQVPGPAKMQPSGAQPSAHPPARCTDDFFCALSVSASA